ATAPGRLARQDLGALVRDDSQLDVREIRQHEWRRRRRGWRRRGRWRWRHRLDGLDRSVAPVAAGIEIVEDLAERELLGVRVLVAIIVKIQTALAVVLLGVGKTAARNAHAVEIVDQFLKR